MKLFKKPLTYDANKLVKVKLDLIDSVEINSFADLGGVWGVDGGYTFYPLENHIISKAFLVDTHFSDVVENNARKFPQLKLLTGSFGDEKIAREVGKVDAVFFFNVLLHQVTPNWDKVLEMYTPKHFIIYNQQWVGPGNNVRLLDLGEEEYFKNVPHTPNEPPYDNLYSKLDQKHPLHERNWRDVHNIWQWGITDTDLISKLNSLGYRMQSMRNHGQFGKLKNFENHSFLFTKV
ncbi:MAG TPA: hypothetical protein VNY36_03325 [Bacteroidia bacterium]|jgi:hypothetical protein|nr:hypothetical protein [Bacteroidia bacterium]